MNKHDTQVAEKPQLFENESLCRDFDEDCDLVSNKRFCYDYDRSKGQCPYVCGHPEFDTDK